MDLVWLRYGTILYTSSSIFARIVGALDSSAKVSQRALRIVKTKPLEWIWFMLDNGLNISKANCSLQKQIATDGFVDFAAKMY